MRRAISILVLLASPALAGSVIVGENSKAIRNPETLEEYEVYVRQMDVVLDSQIQEILELSRSEGAAFLKSTFREWREFVDLECEIRGREAKSEIGELLCVSEYLDGRYLEHELRIFELEQERDDKP